MSRPSRGSEATESGDRALPLLGATVWVAALVLVSGCGGPEAPPRAPGSALWVDASSRPLGRAELGRLEGSGVGELFVEAASLRWDTGGPELVREEGYSPPRRVRSTLVVIGEWMPGKLRGAEAARRLTPSLTSLVTEAEGRRLHVVGVHFDLVGDPAGDALEEYGRFLAEARRQLAPDLAVSATLPVSWLGVPQVHKLAAGTSYLVPFLYGQRKGEGEDASAWDLRRMREALGAVDGLGRPFLLGVVTTGAGTVYGPGGELLGPASGVGLEQLAWNRSFEPVLGSALEALDRQVYAFEARASFRLGDLAVPRGSAIRLVGASTAHLARVLQEVREAGPKHHLGQLFYRLPGPGDAMSLDSTHLINALAGKPTAPAPEASLVVTGRSPGRWLVRLTLENSSDESSVLSHLDHNFVEVVVEGGSFGSVEPGEFYRWDRLAQGADGELGRVLRGATVLRLYAPVLAGGARLESGPIELRLHQAGPPRIRVGARFLAAYGQEAVFGPLLWEAAETELR